MSRSLEAGIQAQYKYQTVHYSQFNTPPAAPLILVSRPWAFMRGELERKMRASRGDRRKSWQAALEYSMLAEQFYDAASRAKFPVNATLYYYGMLNLAKTLICARGKLLGGNQEQHGLILGEPGKGKVEVLGRSTAVTSIFYEFARSIGTPVTRRQSFDLVEVISHIPEMHELAFHSGVLSGSKRAFLPITIDVLVSKNRQWLFSEMRYQKKHEVRVAHNRFYSGSRKRYFRAGFERDGCVVFRSKFRKRISKDNWPRIYANLRREYEDFNLASILTRDGYRYYCDLGAPGFHHLCYSIMLCFYVGAVARYRPSEVATVLARGPNHAVVQEAIENVPIQFLYQMTGHITDSVCVIPYSSIA